VLAEVTTVWCEEKHCAIEGAAIALNDAMWQKYKIGESMKINDPETKAPAIKNPFLEPKPGILPVDDMALDRLLASGAIVAPGVSGIR